MNNGLDRKVQLTTGTQTNFADDEFPADLLVELDRSRPRTLRAQLERGLRQAIARKTLAPGTVLPPSRVRAAELGLARSLVVGAYEQLVIEGYLEARQGSGTRVRAPGIDSRQAAAGPGDSPYWPLPLGHDGKVSRSGMPDPALFPRNEWLRHYRDVLQDLPDMGLLYPALGRRGVTRVAVEDPCFLFPRSIIAASGLEAVPVPVDDQGIQTSRLAELDAEAVLLSPAHSYPSGVALSPDRRVSLLDWARKSGALVIEDDYDAELRYDRLPVGALQGLDPDRVAYGGSASKVLSPALRLGWIVAPPELAGDIIRVRLYEDFAPEALGQLTLARFIDSGGFARPPRRGRPTQPAARRPPPAA